MTSLLQGDGEGCVGQGIGWRQRGERQGRSDGLLEAPRVSEGAYQAMMGLETAGIRSDRSTKALDCAERIAGCKLIQPLQRMGFRGVFVRFRHDILQDKGLRQLPPWNETARSRR